MKRVLITGGAGFIGSNFVRHLFNKYPDYQILVLDALTYAGNLENLGREMRESPRFQFWHGNVRNPEIVNELASKVDAIVHFAAESHVARSIFDNAVFFETDVLGTQVVANSVVKNRNVERFIHISTSEVYGTAIEAPMTENHPLNPLTPYASAKAGADRLVYSYWSTYGIPAVILRPFNNYGPYQHLEKVVPRFITSALLDEPLTIHGLGNCSRDWIFVEDCCEAVDAVLHTDLSLVKGKVLNLGTGRDVDILALAHLILDKLNKPASLITHIGDRPGQVHRHIACIDCAKETLGWTPKTDLSVGLEKTIEWYAENRNWWERMRWMRLVPIKTIEGNIEYH